MRLSSAPRPRSGFTMIELMIVIVILVMLSALLLSGINKVLVYVDEVRATSEVSKLAEACETFRLEFGLYPPSRITFSERGTQDSGGNPLMDPYSIQYLNRLFPGIDLDLFLTSGGSQYHDWNGNGVADANPYSLTGQECLVHFLGGPTYSAVGSTVPLGWHTDKANPTRQPSATASRLGPFYEFNSARLNVPNNWDATRNVWGGYNDPYGTRYAYFLATDLSMNNYRGFLTRFGEVNDCATLCGVNFMPYFASPPNPVVPSMGTPQPNLIKFHRSDKFQIISAGRDRRFGQGGHYNQADPQASVWNPNSGIPADQGRAGNPSLADRVSDDYDNVTNFSEGKLVQ